MSTYELYHHGTKGMRWGVRRYQNKDGTLTDAGKRRYDRDQRENAGKKKGNKVGAADPHRWVKEDWQRSKNLADQGSKAARDLKNFNDRTAKKRRKYNMDLSTMTDAQMRNEINRALLERQYQDMFNPQQVSKGRKVVSTTLSIAGGALAATSSALGIALAIKELTG